MLGCSGAGGINATANTGTLVLLDPLSGTATVIGSSASQIALVDGSGSPVHLPPASGGWGIDFNPTADRLRVVTEGGLNFRINPSSGVAVDGDSNAAGTNPDGLISGLTSGMNGLAGAAYTNAYGGATATSLYLLDASANRLCMSTNPNLGAAATCVALSLGSQPLDVSATSEIDLGPDVVVSTTNAAATGVADAVIGIGGKAHFFTIDLPTGAAIDRGQVGSSGPALSGIAVGHASVK